MWRTSKPDRIWCKCGVYLNQTEYGVNVAWGTSKPDRIWCKCGVHLNQTEYGVNVAYI